VFARQVVWPYMRLALGLWMMLRTLVAVARIASKEPAFFPSAWNSAWAIVVTAALVAVDIVRRSEQPLLYALGVTPARVVVVAMLVPFVAEILLLLAMTALR